MSEKIMKAFIRGTSIVGIGDEVPDGAIYLTAAPATLLAQTLDALCQHADDGSFMYVAAVYEAESASAAMDAVLDFQDLLITRLSSAPAEGGDYVRTSTPRI